MATTSQAKAIWTGEVVDVCLDWFSMMQIRLGKNGFGFGFLVLRIDGFYQQVADKARHQQRSHDIHRGVVGTGLGHAFGEARRLATGNVLFAKERNEVGAEDGGGAPGREQPTVDGPHLQRAKHVAEVGGDGGETRAVHREDDAERTHKQARAAEVARRGHQRIQHGPQPKVDHVDAFAPRFVRQRRPEEAAHQVKQAQQPHKTCRSFGGDAQPRPTPPFRKHLLDHGRCLR